MKGFRRIRPMGIADILDETVELYRSGFSLLVGLAAVVYVPFFLVDGLLVGYRQPAGVEELPRFLGVAVVELLVLLLLGTFVTGAMTIAISERYLERQTSIGACIGRMLNPSVFVPFLMAVLLKYLIVFLPVAAAAGLVGAAAVFTMPGLPESAATIALLGLFAIPGMVFFLLFVLTRLALVEPCFILEMKGVTRAIGRSWSLVRGHTLRAFGVLAIVSIVTWLVQTVLTAPTQAVIYFRPEGAPDPSRLLIAVHVVLSTATSSLLMPIISIATVLLYYDLRIRREGFDLEMMAAELDARGLQSKLALPGLPEEQLPPLPGPKGESTE